MVLLKNQRPNRGKSKSYRTWTQDMRHASGLSVEPVYQSLLRNDSRVAVKNLLLRTGSREKMLRYAESHENRIENQQVS